MFRLVDALIESVSGCAKRTRVELVKNLKLYSVWLAAVLDGPDIAYAGNIPPTQHRASRTY